MDASCIRAWEIKICQEINRHSMLYSRYLITAPLKGPSRTLIGRETPSTEERGQLKMRMLSFRVIPHFQQTAAFGYNGYSKRTSIIRNNVEF
jgi:hypothetical protein